MKVEIDISDLEKFLAKLREVERLLYVKVLSEYQTDEDGNKFTLDENEKLHSYNGKPSLVDTDGTQLWYKHGQLHNDRGLALVRKDGTGQYYLNGRHYYKEEWEKKVAALNEQPNARNKDLTQYQRDEHGMLFTVDENGRYHSYNDSPSMIFTDGERQWHRHGKSHRTTGPAAILSNGEELYYLESQYMPLPKKEWEKKVAALKEQSDLSQYQEHQNGAKFTVDKDGEFHSYNGQPSVVHPDGTKYYHKHGARHNENGPAVEYSYGAKYYFLEGVEFSKIQWSIFVSSLQSLKDQKSGKNL